MQTKTITTYDFNELSDDAKEVALKANRTFNVDDSRWHESVIDDIKEVGKILGITIEKVYFTGFDSQNDGACFEGTYQYAKGSHKAIKARVARLGSKLCGIARRLQELQRLHSYRLSADVKQSGRYMNSDSTEIAVAAYRYGLVDVETYFDVANELRAFMDWSYGRLMTKYNSLTSDETVAKSLQANGIQFLANGQRA